MGIVLSGEIELEVDLDILVVFSEECAGEAASAVPILADPVEHCEEIDDDGVSELCESTFPFLEDSCSLSLILIEFGLPTDNFSEGEFPCKFGNTMF